MREIRSTNYTIEIILNERRPEALRLNHSWKQPRDPASQLRAIATVHRPLGSPLFQACASPDIGGFPKIPEPRDLVWYPDVIADVGAHGGILN